MESWRAGEVQSRRVTAESHACACCADAPTSHKNTYEVFLSHRGTGNNNGAVDGAHQHREWLQCCCRGFHPNASMLNTKQLRMEYDGFSLRLMNTGAFAWCHSAPSCAGTASTTLATWSDRTERHVARTLRGARISSSSACDTFVTTSRFLGTLLVTTLLATGLLSVPRPVTTHCLPH